MHLNPFIVYFTRFRLLAVLLIQFIQIHFKFGHIRPGLQNYLIPQIGNYIRCMKKKQKIPNSIKIFNLDVYPKSKKCVIGIP